MQQPPRRAPLAATSGNVAATSLGGAGAARKPATAAAAAAVPAARPPPASTEMPPATRPRYMTATAASSSRGGASAASSTTARPTTTMPPRAHAAGTASAAPPSLDDSKEEALREIMRSEAGAADVSTDDVGGTASVSVVVDDAAGPDVTTMMSSDEISELPAPPSATMTTVGRSVARLVPPTLPIPAPIPTPTPTPTPTTTTTTTTTATTTVPMTHLPPPSESLIVAVRVRPLNPFEREQNARETYRVVSGNCIAASFSGDAATAAREDQVWAFDRAFAPDVSTQTVYDDIASPVVASAMAGINGTIFAYGQTASGKTHTMQGTDMTPGILHLAARQLFDEAAKTPDVDYTFVASYIEIYNERVKDLLTTASNRAALEAASDLSIREDRVNGFYVDGVTVTEVTSHEDVLALHRRGESRRHVAGTDMNEKSSRSHTIFTINVTAKERGPAITFGTLKARLTLVDLAGSENVRNTHAEGERLKEGSKINTSLLMLSRVISALAANASSTRKTPAFVNFRDSKLTQILQPSLAGNCRTVVVCCVTPASTFAAETNSTLMFASSAKRVRTQVVVNQIADVSRSIKSYQ